MSASRASTIGPNDWDRLITPAAPWWRVDLHELWRYRDLVLLLVKRDITAQFKQTILGPLWLILQPLLTTAVYTVMFGMITRSSPPGVPALLFYLSGIVPWIYFSGLVNRTSRTFTGNASVLTKVYFPRLVMPLSTMLGALFQFAVQFALLLLIFVWFLVFRGFHWTPDAGLMALPIALLVMSLLGLGAGILVSALTTRYRDLGFLVTYGIQLLMFISPVIFPISLIIEKAPFLVPLVKANPMTGVIEGIRSGLFGTPLDVLSLAYSGLFAVVLFLAGLAMFQRVERSFADTV